MPDWATITALYTFTLGLAFYSGRLTVKVDTLKESYQEFKDEMKQEFSDLKFDIDLIRKHIDTRAVINKR
jgi:hypothetical protein